MRGIRREEFTARNLLQSGGVEDIVNSGHCAAAAFEAADVADVEFDFRSHVREFSLVFVTHIVLLLLIAGEDADFFYVCGEETVQYGVAE